MLRLMIVAIMIVTCMIQVGDADDGENRDCEKKKIVVVMMTNIFSFSNDIILSIKYKQNKS